MYCKYYNLRNRPFDLSPKGGLVYLSKTHREGVALLKYGVLADKGFILLTGGVGTGKTTILNTVLPAIEKQALVCVLNNPTLERDEFYRYLGEKIGIPFNGNKGDFLIQTSKILKKFTKLQKKIILIIDEAQAFSVKMLEEIRLLSNLADQHHNALGIFLIGQPELQKKLSTLVLLPLRQRIGVMYNLSPFDRKNTEQYIAYRLNAAGGTQTNLFDKQAINLIHKKCKGNPRLINIICDQALLLGFTQEKKRLGKKIINECFKHVLLEDETHLSTSEDRLENSKPVPQGKFRTRTTAATIFILLCTVILGVAIYLFQNDLIQLLNRTFPLS